MVHGSSKACPWQGLQVCGPEARSVLAGLGVAAEPGYGAAREFGFVRSETYV